MKLAPTKCSILTGHEVEGIRERLRKMADKGPPQYENTARPLVRDTLKLREKNLALGHPSAAPLSAKAKYTLVDPCPPDLRTLKATAGVEFDLKAGKRVDSKRQNAIDPVGLAKDLYNSFGEACQGVGMCDHLFRFIRAPPPVMFENGCTGGSLYMTQLNRLINADECGEFVCFGESDKYMGETGPRGFFHAARAVRYTSLARHKEAGGHIFVSGPPEQWH